MCGAVRVSVDPGAVLKAYHCHCEDCRRACSAPFTTWMRVRDTGFRWTRGRPATRESAPGVTRGFCGACGSPMSYASEEAPGETDLYVAALEDPEAVTPEYHEFWSERLTWIAIADDLAKKG